MHGTIAIRKHANRGLMVDRLQSVGLTAVFGAIAIVSLCFPSLAIVMQFDRSAVSSGEWWRVVTGHTTHWNLDHLLWDLLVFVVLASVCEMLDRGRFLLCMVGSGIAVSLALLLLEPDVHVYRGLSGLDSALFALLMVTMLRAPAVRHDWRWLAAVLAVSAGFGAKIIFEHVAGQTVFVDSTAARFTPIPLAHVVGAATGALTGLMPARRAIDR